MRATTRRTVIIALAGSPWLTACGELPTEATLLNRFRAARPDLERIVAMARQEHEVTRIAPDFIWLADNSDPTPERRRRALPDARWREYRRLFRRTRVSDGIGIGDGVFFYVSDVGLAGSGASKGFRWSKTAQTPLVDHIDDPGNRKPGGWDVFRRIDENWYLEYSAS